VKKLLLLLILSLSLSGCINYIQDVQLYADGSGSMRITFWTKLPDNESTKILDKMGIGIFTGFGINGNAFRVTYKYTFGGDIINDNSTSKDGRTLIWDYTLSQIGIGKMISVTFRPFKLKETPPWIYALSGLVLLIVIIFLLRKKKD
jgi:hypothetical protein